MARRQQNNWVWWALAGILLLRHVATGGALRSLFLSSAQIASMYKEMIDAGTNITYTVVRDGQEIYWHIDLARATTNYEAVMAAYSRAYGRNLSNDLLQYFNSLGHIHLSEYVAELWNKNGQVMLQ